MAFGRRKGNDDTPATPATPDAVVSADAAAGPPQPDSAAGPESVEAAAGPGPGEELEGPFDIEDFDDPAAAEQARLDLGSVLIPIPEGGQLQVELTDTGAPSALWVVTPNGRYSIAAYAAPKTAGLWREVAGELAESLRKDSVAVAIHDGQWGREVVGTATGSVRFIGVDGYRWMVRCVVNGSHETFDALTEEARKALADTVVRRGDTPLPVRTPLPVELPDFLVERLRDAMAAQQDTPNTPPAGGAPAPSARRSAAGSAMQQLRSTTGG